jgi:hypothetical protein
MRHINNKIKGADVGSMWQAQRKMKKAIMASPSVP